MLCCLISCICVIYALPQPIDRGGPVDGLSDNDSFRVDLYHRRVSGDYIGDKKCSR